jgi:hypothetical protein
MALCLDQCGRSIHYGYGHYIKVVELVDANEGTVRKLSDDP